MRHGLVLTSAQQTIELQNGQGSGTCVLMHELCCRLSTQWPCLGILFTKQGGQALRHCERSSRSKSADFFERRQPFFVFSISVMPKLQVDAQLFVLLHFGFTKEEHFLFFSFGILLPSSVSFHIDLHGSEFDWLE